MVDVISFGKMVQVTIKGLNNISEGDIIKQLDIIPELETVVSMPYFSTDSGKIRHCQVKVDEAGQILVENIDEVNENLNGSLVFIRK